MPGVSRPGSFWIPACAGMTKGDAGMTKGDAGSPPPKAGDCSRA